MKITSYSWNKYMSVRASQRGSSKLKILFKIRDAVTEADKKNEERVVINFNKTRDYKWILGYAGSIHYYWVIDYVIDHNFTITLLYRNCRIHGQTDPAALWEDKLNTAKSIEG